MGVWLILNHFLTFTKFYFVMATFNKKINAEVAAKLNEMLTADKGFLVINAGEGVRGSLPDALKLMFPRSNKLARGVVKIDFATATTIDTVIDNKESKYHKDTIRSVMVTCVWGDVTFIAKINGGDFARIAQLDAEDFTFRVDYTDGKTKNSSGQFPEYSQIIPIAAATEKDIEKYAVKEPEAELTA